MYPEILCFSSHYLFDSSMDPTSTSNVAGTCQSVGQILAGDSGDFGEFRFIISQTLPPKPSQC